MSLPSLCASYLITVIFLLGSAASQTGACSRFLQVYCCRCAHCKSVFCMIYAIIYVFSVWFRLNNLKTESRIYMTTWLESYHFVCASNFKSIHVMIFLWNFCLKHKGARRHRKWDQKAWMSGLITEGCYLASLVAQKLCNSYSLLGPKLVSTEDIKSFDICYFNIVLCSKNLVMRWF